MLSVQSVELFHCFALKASLRDERDVVGLVESGRFQHNDVAVEVGDAKGGGIDVDDVEGFAIDEDCGA